MIDTEHIRAELRAELCHTLELAERTIEHLTDSPARADRLAEHVEYQRARAALLRHLIAEIDEVDVPADHARQRADRAEAEVERLRLDRDTLRVEADFHREAIARVRALCDAENRRIAERTTLGSNPREWAALLRVQDVEAAIDGTEAGRCVCGQPGAQGVTHRQDGPCYVTGSDNG